MSTPKPERKRLDLLLVERGLSPTREKARALILSGTVRVGGERVDKASALVPATAELEAADAGAGYASRGAYKLLHALDAFDLEVAGRIALDAGASTGGFTDALLRRGAARVYAVDVGYGQLDWRLRNDPRVVVMERTNVRHLAELPERADVVVADLSFISLTLVLPALSRVASDEAVFVLLIKPQFEAGREQVGKNGVVRDPAVHAAVLRTVLDAAHANRLHRRGLTASPVLGPAGNVEFLALFARGERAAGDEDAAIARALAEAESARAVRKDERP